MADRPVRCTGPHRHQGHIDTGDMTTSRLAVLGRPHAAQGCRSGRASARAGASSWADRTAEYAYYHPESAQSARSGASPGLSAAPPPSAGMVPGAIGPRPTGRDPPGRVLRLVGFSKRTASSTRRALTVARIDHVGVSALGRDACRRCSRATTEDPDTRPRGVAAPATAARVALRRVSRSCARLPEVIEPVRAMIRRIDRSMGEAVPRSDGIEFRQRIDCPHGWSRMAQISIASTDTPAIAQRRCAPRARGAARCRRRYLRASRPADAHAAPIRINDTTRHHTLRDGEAPRGLPIEEPAFCST